MKSNFDSKYTYSLLLGQLKISFIALCQVWLKLA